MRRNKLKTEGWRVEVDCFDMDGCDLDRAHGVLQFMAGRARRSGCGGLAIVLGVEPRAIHVRDNTH